MHYFETMSSAWLCLCTPLGDFCPSQPLIAHSWENRAGISSIWSYHLYSSRDILRNFWQMLLMVVMFLTF